mgnify:CR=1 FL=1
MHRILHHGKGPRMFESHVFARSTAHSAVLYWDKPAAAKAGAQYTVYLGGQPVATCGRTHFTLTDLRSQSDYQADVFFGHQCVGSCVFRTTPIKNRLDVTEAPFWARGDGKTKNTAALQRAIDACSAGDAVYIPAGIYLTGALRLHSNMELYLDEGAILQGTAEIVDYQPRIPSRFEGTEMRCYSSLLNLGTLDHAAGPNCENVVIRGKGTIASGGRELAEKIIADEQEHLKDYLAEHAALVAECENERTIPGRVRPRLINMSNCRNVWVHGLTLKNGASWNQHMIYSDNITTDHCRFVSEGVWNGDGWDPDSSTNCTLFACEFATGGDAVAIKSGKNPEGNKIGRPSAHIYVFDCRSTHNPGRYEPYKALTGLDEPVIRFLEEDGEILTFLDSVYKLADAHVARYLRRGFTDLMFAFGCTGGRHRSVYSAQHLAEHLHAKFGIEVRICHREQNIERILPPTEL